LVFADRASTIPEANALNQYIALVHSWGRLFDPFSGGTIGWDANS
jgi:hypothetical protein